MRPRAARITLLALLVGAVFSTAAVAASPRPVDVCQPCGDRFASTITHETSTETDVTESVATVEVDRNGTGVWTIHNELSNASAAAYLREHPGELREVARDAFVPHDTELQSVRVTDGDAVVLKYTMPGFATRTAGVWRIDYFRDDPGSYVYIGLGADELTVVGPEGTRVTSGLAGSTDDGRRTTVTEYRDQGDGSFVVFAPADDALGAARTVVAVGEAVADLVVRNLFLLVLIPGAVFGALAWGCSRAAAEGYLESGRDSARRVAALVIGLGLVAGALSTPVAEQPLVDGAYPLGLVGGVATVVIGVVTWLWPDELTVPRQVGVIAGGTLAGIGAWSALAVVTGGSVGPKPQITAVLPILPSLWLLLVGSTGNADARTRWVVIAVPPLAWVIAETWRYPMTSAGGTLFLIVPVLFVGYAVVATVAGLPLWALGAALPAREPPVPSRGEHRAAEPQRRGGD